LIVDIRGKAKPKFLGREERKYSVGLGIDGKIILKSIGENSVGRCG
jgi:hypothetical protein